LAILRDKIALTSRALRPASAQRTQTFISYTWRATAQAVTAVTLFYK